MGCDALPTIYLLTLIIRSLFNGENGVIRTWLRRGARGWRLDVADEISDSFIRKIRTAALAGQRCSRVERSGRTQAINARAATQTVS